jgi:hypothetical protein
MGLPWVRLDTSFASNPKVLATIAERDGHRAIFVYLASLAYSGAQGSDGFIPSYVLPHIHGRPRDAQLLTTHRLWLPVDTGWLINDWAQFQQSSAETQERAAKLRLGGIKANCIRWHGSDCGCWKDSQT